MKRRLLLGLVATVMTFSLVACGGDKPAEDANALKDGKYEVEANADDKGNTAKLTVEVAEGKISTVVYNEITKDGKNKREDENYNKMMKEKSGTNPAEFEVALEKQLVEKQAAEVDGVTGATGSSAKFKAMAAKALESAKAGNTEAVKGDF